MAGELARAGMQPLVVPLLVAHATNEPFPADRYKHVIFVSEHAVSFAKAAFEAQNARLLSLAPAAQWYAIGPATETALAAALDGSEQNPSKAMSKATGPQITVPEPARSEGLLEQYLHNIAGETVLIVAGVAGRALLPDTLGARGAIVKSWLVYRRTEQPPEPSTWAAARNADVVVASSGQGLELLTRYWSDGDDKLATDSPAGDKSSDLRTPGTWRDRSLDVPVCVPSPRVHELAKKLGWLKPVNCPGASARATITGLLNDGLWSQAKLTNSIKHTE